MCIIIIDKGHCTMYKDISAGKNSSHVTKNKTFAAKQIHCFGLQIGQQQIMSLVLLLLRNGIFCCYLLVKILTKRCFSAIIW